MDYQKFQTIESQYDQRRNTQVHAATQDQAYQAQINSLPNRSDISREDKAYIPINLEASGKSGLAAALSQKDSLQDGSLPIELQQDKQDFKTSDQTSKQTDLKGSSSKDHIQSKTDSKKSPMASPRLYKQSTARLMAKELQ